MTPSEFSYPAHRHIHEECGVFGIYSPVNAPLAQLMYYGL